MPRTVAESMYQSTNKDDAEDISVTVTRRELRIMLGLVRAAYRQHEKKAEYHTRRNGGREFVPEPGRVDTTQLARAYLVQTERRLCGQAGMEPVLPEMPMPVRKL